MPPNTPEPDDRTENRDEPATTVVREIADGKDADPLDLGRLSETVDPDALNDLVTRSPGAVRIEFEYERHRVTVRGDGQVHVE